MIRNIIVLLLIGMMAGCTNSLVYSPSLHLPTEPLKAKEFDLLTGIELFPETRPEALDGNPTTFGLHGQTSYGFSDNFNLSLKAWTDLGAREGLVRSGFALQGQFISRIDESSSIITIPRIGFAIGDIFSSGFGLGASVIYHRAITEETSLYGGGGLLWGVYDFHKMPNSNNIEKKPMGYGIIGNVGIGWQLSNNMRLNCEFNPIYQINTFDENQQFFISPSLGIGYTIK